MERGKPSIKKGPGFPSMPARNSSTVVSDCTILPWSMTALISLPSFEPEATSARSKSPAER